MAAVLKTFDELLHETVAEFKRQFQVKPDIAACAPGRVNLIGEHIDYVDGFVLPMVSKRRSATDHFSSLDNGEFTLRRYPAVLFFNFCIVEQISNWLLIESTPHTLQALPMVTLIIGRKNGTKNLCNISTLCPGVDEPKQTQFKSDNLQPGIPK